MYSTSMPVYRRVYYNIYIYPPVNIAIDVENPPSKCSSFSEWETSHGFSTSMGHPMCELIKLHGMFYGFFHGSHQRVDG